MYIGAEPNIGNYSMLDAITTSATATYNLLKGGASYTPENPLGVICSLNGVIQKAGSSFNIVNNTIVFSQALTSNDSIDFILVMGERIDLNVPADASVTNAKTNFVSTSSNAGLQIKGDGTTDGTLQLNCSQNSHGIKIKSPPHSASASYTLTMPNNDGNANQVLTTDGSGVLSFADAGGGSLVHITTTVVGSDTGYVNFNNCFTADYDVYRLHWSNFYNASADNQRLVSYFMDTSGNHLGSGQYETVASLAYANSGTDGDASGRDWGVNFLVHTNGSVHRGVASSGYIDIFNPRDGSNRVTYNGHCFYHNGSHHYASNYSGTLANSVEIFGINFTVTGGAIKADTTFSVYGYTKS